MSHAETVKFKLEYLPVVPLPPHDNIVKWYMENIVQIMEEIRIEELFVHADDTINSKIVMIMWLYNDKYENVIPLIGGFHIFLLYLKILYKKYNCLGLQDWWVDAGAILEGSVCKAIESKHYQGGISLHNQSMNVLLRIKIERNIQIDQDMKDAIANLRLHIKSDNLDKLLELNSFKNYNKLLFADTSGTQACMMKQYIKDVSSMLALIFVVREKKLSCTWLQNENCFLNVLHSIISTNHVT